ncbi:MAG TPA: HEAT repeat domain-containing protein [Pyrinomonadaceae bacterium]|nr:HEAT repeat domain-containing protein [Pyrinomonadaceae bacterium]
MSDDFIQTNGRDAQVVVAPKPRRPSNIWLIIVASLFIIVPFLSWYFTWFGRSLSDEKIVEYLNDEKKPRNIQHALTQIESRMEKNDPAVKKFYPRILELAKSPTGEVRKTVAWVMGQDNTSEDFHRALLELLKDAEPLVRRNAALQLVRFGDASGRPELRAMLQPFEAKSPINGTIVSILPVGSELRAGALFARIRVVSSPSSLITHDSSPITGSASPNTQHPSPVTVLGDVQEFRAPVDGEIASLAVKEGDAVTVGQTVASLKPDKASVSAALRGLAYVGTAEDLPSIESLAQTVGDDEIASQASTTAKAIRSRVSSSQQ